MILHINNLIGLINSGIKSNKLFVIAPFNRCLIPILNIFIDEGFIFGYNFKKKDNKLLIQIKLKYHHNINVFIRLKSISRKSKKVYWSYNQLSYNLNWNKKNSYILSTTSGIISHKEAMKQKIGGFVLCSYC